MGTRHYQTVINKEGKTKIAQYGQWDGYPDGQGVSILNYLLSGDLTKYQENLEKIRLATQQDIDTVNSNPQWKEQYPYLSRDCGSDIHKMIEDGRVEFVQHMDKDEAEKWCEGFYTIDFSTNLFVSEFHGRKSEYKLDELPTEKQYLQSMSFQDEEE